MDSSEWFYNYSSPSSLNRAPFLHHPNPLMVKKAILLLSFDVVISAIFSKNCKSHFTLS